MPIFVFMEQGFVAIGIGCVFYYIHGRYRIHMYTPCVLTRDARISTFHPGNKRGAPLCCLAILCNFTNSVILAALFSIVFRRDIFIQMMIETIKDILKFIESECQQW